jgi:protoheme IX farnesyltransferase
MNLSAYFEICKPRVVWLMLVTAYVGMQLASPGWVPLDLAFWGLLGIGLMSSSAAVINHIVDQEIDAKMARTKRRPLPTGKISTRNAALFASILGVAGFVILFFKVNGFTSVLTFFALIGYAVIYTMFLKRMTPQNIVWGGLAGAAPPLLGWTAITGYFQWNSLILVAIIFIWTPPHFWALAIYRFNEYKKIEHIPMLPVTHGIAYTKNSILVYSVLLLIVGWLPCMVGMSGLVYFVGSTILGGVFLYYALRLKLSSDPLGGRTLFRYSIIYLLILFIVLFLDHFIFLSCPWREII